MKEKIRQFMTGRYGVDALGRALTVLVFVLLVLGLLGIPLITPLALIVLFFCYYRMLSKDYARRSAENAQWLQWRHRVTHWFTTRKQRFAQRKQYTYLRCPSCKQDLRIPRGNGNVSVTCPKCHTRFDGKS